MPARKAKAKPAPAAGGFQRDPFGPGWQRRVTSEAVQIGLKIDALQQMLRRPATIGYRHQFALMKQQLAHLRAYHDVLNDRIADFSLSREEEVAQNDPDS
jgi:hypothetical protein